MIAIIQQFPYKFFQPNGVDPVIDCRVIENPFNPKLTDEQMIAKVRAAPQFERVVEQALEELKRHPQIWVGCLYGRHRSGAVIAEVVERYPGTIQIIRHPRCK